MKDLILTPRTDAILKMIKEFNIEVNKFLLSVEKLEEVLLRIEDNNTENSMSSLMNDELSKSKSNTRESSKIYEQVQREEWFE